MQIWQIILVSHVSLSLVLAVILFKVRKTYSPGRTDVLPSIIASLVSAVLWPAVLPLALVASLREQTRRSKAKEAEKAGDSPASVKGEARESQ